MLINPLSSSAPLAKFCADDATCCIELVISSTLAVTSSLAAALSSATLETALIPLDTLSELLIGVN